MNKNSILNKLYLMIIFLLLYAPIFILIGLSFNGSKHRSINGGFSLKWYYSLFHNHEIITALYNTVVIALISAFIATILGTLAAIGISNMNKKSQTISMAVTNIPLLNSDIVTGISLMMLFISVLEIIRKITGLHLNMGFGSILISHITFNIPYVILSVRPHLKKMDRTTYEAALDLGASPFYAFRKIVIKELLPGIFAGFLLAVTMSLDDFIITYFIKGPGIDTLSTKIYSEVKKGIKPEMYALSTIMFGTVLILLILINYLSDKKNTIKDGKH